MSLYLTTPVSAPDTDGDCVLRASCLQCEHYPACDVPECLGPMDERTVALTVKIVDGSVLLLASVTADTAAEATEAGAELAQRLSIAGELVA